MQRLWQSTADSLKTLSPSRRRIAFIAAVVFVIAFVTVLTANKGRMTVQPDPNSAANSFLRERLPVPSDPSKPEDDLKSKIDNAEALVSGGAPRASYFPTAPAEPRIAYSAELAVTTKDFSRARSSMEEILDRHRGYTSRLRMVGHAGSSTLSATLKVPASEYPSALADLKSVGNVEQDEEAADEIVQQRGDIEARLQNAQNEEKKLQLLLKDRDSKVLDPAALDRRLTALHTDIVQMELQRHSFDSRAVFSNIHFSLHEEHDVPAESLSAQFRAAAGSGFTDAIHGLSAILLVLINYGPSLLLWSAILFFPARYLWRRLCVPLASSAA
ncbi:MAG TPA: DUF4349 domain-containing protein [Candidatus Limnocylindrales bacterium]|nr:DUF4349 domain-containing protein [Candidatus Limnocylindrales bacterium]